VRPRLVSGAHGRPLGLTSLTTKTKWEPSQLWENAGVEYLEPLPLLLRETGQPAETEVAVGLLEHAGWSRHHLHAWVLTGTVLELYDPADDLPCGAAIVRSEIEGTFEVLAWATTLNLTDQATAGRLMRAIADALRAVGARRVIAAVGDARPEQLVPLLDAGFRFVSVERDAPLASRGAPLDGSRDLVWMDQEL